MLSQVSSLTSEELRSAIVPDPLVVSPDTTVMEAIGRMSGLRSQCEHPRSPDLQLEQIHLEARSSCVIVMEEDQVVGILTERDVIRLATEQQSLGQLTMQQVMTQPVYTLREDDFTDVFATVNQLQQQRIRHLPLLDRQGYLVGLITHESLQYTARMLNVLRLRQVMEVMNKGVICASPASSLLEIAKQMVEHRVSSVVLVEPVEHIAGSLCTPIGIITERDLVQFQALDLSWATTTSQDVMSKPLFAVEPNDSLWSVQALMAQHSIHRVVVTGPQGELVGIVTQSSLLQALNPLEILNLAAVLEAKVQRLEAEKVELLENQTSELEQLVEARILWDS